jgi:nucleotide-binding universal stress UspA family protein
LHRRWYGGSGAAPGRLRRRRKEIAMSVSDWPQAAVVVGVDETPSAREALLWAAREAALRGSPLVVAHAYRHLGWPVDAATEAANRERAWRLVRRQADLAAATERGLAAVPRAARGAVREVLYGAVERPEMFVVGCRHRGSAAAALLGSTGVDLARQTPHPVVVVRSEPVPPGHPPAFAGHVVAGIDHSVQGRTVLEFAFAHAARHGRPLAVVHVGVHDPAETWRDLTFGELHEETPDPEWQLLEEVVEPLRARYPGVPVKLAVHQAPAAAGLLRSARGAELLVVGTAGHGRLGGALGLSVSRSMVTHSPCPVAVVPASAVVTLTAASPGGGPPA